MTKPITVAAEEFSQALLKLVNSSGLPAFVINQILVQMTSELSKLAKQQYDNDLKQYQDRMQEIKHKAPREKEMADEKDNP